MLSTGTMRAFVPFDTRNASQLHCKFTKFPALLQAFSKPENTYGNFLPLMATYPAKKFASLADF